MLEGAKNVFGNFQCACCGFFTIKHIKEICPVCFWEEDNYQQEYIDDEGGPNSLCLRASQENYKKLGVMDMKFKEYVRSPMPNELAD